MAGNDDLDPCLLAPLPLGVMSEEIERLRTALSERDAQIERLTKERSEFARSLSEWATKAGEAEGRLTASEWPGVVEGWKARAETAERERDEARGEVERFRSERSYIIGWNDGFAEAQEQHRSEMAKANANLRKVFMEGGCTLFLDGRNEHGSHVIMSYPANMPESAQDDINEYAEEILAEAEKLGFVVGEDHVWTEWRWQEAQIGDDGRVELRGYWEFVRIDEELTRSALTAKGGENAEG